MRSTKTTDRDDGEDESVIPLQTKHCELKSVPNELPSSRCQVNTRMLSSKFAYFFEYAKEGSHWPYLVLFYVSIGLSPTQAGFIGGIRFIGGLFGAPVCGWIADQSGLHCQVAIIVCVFAAATNICQPVVSMLMGDPSKNFCHGNYHHVLKTPGLNSSVLLIPSFASFHDATEASELFYTLILVSTVASFFDGSTMGFVDSGVLRKILDSPVPTDIGKQRLFGPPGVGLAAFVSGLLVDYFPRGSISCYTGIFLTYAITCLGMAVTFYFLVNDINDSKEEDNDCNVDKMDIKQNKNASATSVNKVLLTSLGSVQTWVFFFFVCFNGIALALAFSFSFLFLEELHTPNSIKGLSLCINGFSGLAGFFFSTIMIERLGGNINAMAFSCLSWSLRYLLLSLMKQPYQFLLICLLNGLTCSLIVSAYVGYIRNNFPPKIFTVVCGISAAFYNSGGYVVANIVGGIGYQHLGPRLLFTICCATCLGGSVLIFVYGLVFRRLVSANKSGSHDCITAGKRVP